MEKGYVVKRYGKGGLHITISNKDFNPGDMVIVMVPTMLDDRIRKITEAMIKDAMWKVRQGY